MTDELYRLPAPFLAPLGVLILGILGSPAAGAKAKPDQIPTFHRDVVPVLQRNCQSCHRPGGANYGGMIAPMSFTDYDQTRPWARAMARQVADGEMPPWHASAEQDGLFKNERLITDAEVQTIIDWARGGAPEGDPADAPAPMEWPDLNGWTIGEPDLVIEMPAPYRVEDHVEDEYRYFRHRLTKEQLPEDRWVQAFEFRPGSSAVHHIILMPIGGIAPGSDAQRYSDGIGMRLRAGTELTWQMHYHKEPGPGTAVTDQSRVALKFYPKDTTIPYPVRMAELGNYGFEIPPGDPDHAVETSHTFRRDARLLSFSPHMHLRGKSAHYEALFPDGSRETLLDVPRYDFNWQTTYTYAEPKLVPAGTKVTVTTRWDNSADNPNNPDPTRSVRYGEPTTDEMSIGYLEYIDAAPRTAAEPRGREAAGPGETWRHPELGFSFVVPKRLWPNPETDGIASWAGRRQVPMIDLDAEPIDFPLTAEHITPWLVADFEATGTDVEVRVSESWPVQGRNGVRTVVDWEWGGYPLISLVLAVEHREQLVTATVTHMRRSRIEDLQQLLVGLTFDE